jgi:hypothetical protein
MDTTLRMSSFAGGADVNSGRLIQLFFRDTDAAVERARSLGEVCDAAEDFNKAAIHLKFDLAREKVVRRALNGPSDNVSAPTRRA